MPKIFARASALLIAAMVAVIGLSNAANAEVSRQASFFNSQEIEYAGQGNLNKWQDAVARHSEDGLNGAAAAEWNGIIAKYADLDQADQMFRPELASAINDYNPIYSVNANNWWMHVAN